jgi:hypothetical protein
VPVYHILSASNIASKKKKKRRRRKKRTIELVRAVGAVENTENRRGLNHNCKTEVTYAAPRTTFCNGTADALLRALVTWEMSQCRRAFGGIASANIRKLPARSQSFNTTT